MPPRPEGNVHQQLQRQYAYLFQLAQQLNLMLEATDGGGGTKSAAAVNEEKRQQYQTLRSMIIKTADEVTKEVVLPDITELQQSVIGLQGTTTALGEKTTSVESMTQTLDQLTKKLQQATAGLQTATDGLSSKTTALEGKTATLETATGELTTRTGTLETTTGTLTTKTGALEEATAGLQTATDGLSSKTTVLETRATAQEKAAAALNSETAELGAAVSGCMDSINALGFKMSEKYVAISDFGAYIQKINAEIAANPEAITQYYSFFSVLKANLDKISADFETYKVGTEGYIRTGIVYYEDTLPVYGVAVGQNLTVTEVDGETVIDQTNFRATYTAQKLSFWQDAVEVAYVSNNRLYIKNITVLQAVTVGKWEIDGSDGLAIKWIGG